MVERGFYVHYKGGIYFVQGTAANGDTHDWDDQLVIYEVASSGDEDDEGFGFQRFRTVEDFTRMIDWATGLTDAEAKAKGVVNKGQLIPRFQRVVGFRKGRPLVKDPDGRDGGEYVFVPQLDNHTAHYDPTLGND